MKQNTLTPKLIRGLYLSVMAALLVLLAFSAAQPRLGVRAASTTLVINEIDYDQVGDDTAEFIEIKNVSSGSINLDSYEVRIVNGAGGGASVARTIDLPNVDLAASNYYVICGNPANVANCDLDVSPDTNLIQNGNTAGTDPDAVALILSGSVVDTVSYEGDTGSPYTEGSGTGLEDDPAAAFAGISRFPDGTDTDQNNQDLSQRCITPGTANSSATTNCSDPSDLPMTATKTYELVVDNDSDGKADPGDTLRYTVVITNEGTTAATSMVFSDTIDANTTLSGTVKTTPLARNDSCIATGNVQITVNGVLDDDADPDGGAITVSTFQNPSANGRDVEASATGVFTYNPPAGLEETNTLAAFEAANGTGSNNPKAGDCIFSAALASGETVNVTIGTLPAGKSVTIVFEVTIDTPSIGVLQVCNQGIITGTNLSAVVLTDDPDEAGGTDETCTTLDGRGTIAVVKDADPEDDTDFDFDGGSLGTFTLKDPTSNTKTFQDKATGSYVITETVPTNWSLDDISCLTNDQNDTTITDTVNSKVTIDLDAHETVTCTFTNTLQVGTIVVEKATDPSPDPTDTSFNFIAGGGLNPTNFSLKNGQSRTFDDVPVGSGYSVTETVSSGWDLTSTTCTDGSPVDNIDLSPGETITCTFTNELRLDYGDAPDPNYPTLLASTGASHGLGSDVYLGVCVDAEADGQPSDGADGDDTNAGSPVYGTCVGNDDEDGVTFFTTVSRIGVTTNVDVVANAACTLSAWIDFNADGDWSDADEELFPGGQALAAGVNSLSFSVPSDAVVGTTYARFRCTTDGAVPTTGQASDGEVEDYQVTVQIAIPCSADLDSNWWVNTADLSILVSQWGECEGCSADLNGNGWVNTADLSIFIAQWGECP